MKSFITLTRNCIYFILFSIDKVLNRRSKVIVLCYHGISNNFWKYDISKESFIKQIRYLKSHYELISLEKLENYVLGRTQLRKPSAVITFDDGIKSVLSITQFLKDEGVHPAIFLISESKNVNRSEVGFNHEYIDLKDINKLLKYGWTIGSHSATHADFFHLNNKELTREIDGSKKALEKVINHKIKYFAYPKGRYTPSVLTTVAKSGYTLALTMDDCSVTSHMNLYKIPRIGIDKTHNDLMFKATISPLVVLFRSLIKKTFLVKYL